MIPSNFQFSSETLGDTALQIDKLLQNMQTQSEQPDQKNSKIIASILENSNAYSTLCKDFKCVKETQLVNPSLKKELVQQLVYSAILKKDLAVFQQMITGNSSDLVNNFVETYDLKSVNFTYIQNELDATYLHAYDQPSLDNLGTCMLLQKLGASTLTASESLERLFRFL